MGIMVYSLLWVMQDFVHQPNHRELHLAIRCRPATGSAQNAARTSKIQVERTSVKVGFSVVRGTSE